MRGEKTKPRRNESDVLTFIPCQEAISESGHEILCEPFKQLSWPKNTSFQIFTLKILSNISREIALPLFDAR